MLSICVSVAFFFLSKIASRGEGCFFGEVLNRGGFSGEQRHRKDSKKSRQRTAVRGLLGNAFGHVRSGPVFDCEGENMGKVEENPGRKRELEIGALDEQKKRFDVLSTRLCQLEKSMASSQDSN